ncbi:MAG: hypothetical protein ABSF32_00710 [Ignavibacteria bacterium]|jgi:hypothetical protein
MFNKLLIVLTCALLLYSCAGVNVTRITQENQDEEGIRFYRPYPYLLVVQGSDSIDYRIIWLPKMDEEYAFSVKSGFGTTDYTITLENGWKLTNFNEKRDSKLEELVTSAFGNITGLLKSQLQITREAETKNKNIIPGLYAFIFADKGPNKGLVIGIRKIELESMIDNKK